MKIFFEFIFILFLVVSDPVPAFALHPVAGSRTTTVWFPNEEDAAAKIPVEPWAVVALVASCIFWFAPFGMIASGIARRHIRKNGKRGRKASRIAFYIGLCMLPALAFALLALLLPPK